jgi:hypothetical protein
MIDDLAESFAAWAGSQAAFPLDPSRCSARTVRDFFDLYMASRFRGNSGGSRFNNLLWLHLIARAMRPSVIIDSGTFMGASAWSLALGAPAAAAFSFDVSAPHLLHRLPNVTYVRSDWMRFEWGDIDTDVALCYFDDHVDQARRVFEAHSLGIRYLVFDDDFPCTSFAPMAHGGASLPKVSFLLDEKLDEVDRLEWRQGAATWAWPLEHARIVQARALIECAVRLPNTSIITGIHQTPYRLVRLAVPDARRGRLAGRAD